MVLVASAKSTSTSYLRSVFGLLAVSAFNAALDNHSIVSVRRRRKIRSTASPLPRCAADFGRLSSGSNSKRPSISSPGLFPGPKIPRPMCAPNAELGLPLADPARVIVHLPPAQTHHVPPRRCMIPVAVGHFRKRVPRLQVSDIVGRERDLGGAGFFQEVAHTVHVLPPIQIALGQERLGTPARNLVGVREVIGMRQRARNYLPSQEREQHRCAEPRPSPRRYPASLPQQGGRRHAADYRSEERRVGKECRSRWSPD